MEKNKKNIKYLEEVIIKPNISELNIVKIKDKCLKLIKPFSLNSFFICFSPKDLKELELKVKKEDKKYFKFLKKAQKLWKSSDISFKGFDEKNSTAPPREFVSSGRLNPRFIRYLYVAQEIETAIYEVKPKIKQIISIGKCHPNKILKIYDLTLISIDENNLFYKISEKFSEPSHSEEKDYIPTQYIAEYIKSLGYDGIKFKSSLKKEGNNLVIFEPENFKFISSEIKIVEEINLEIR